MSGTNLRNLKVLIIDDDADLRQLATLLFKKEGADVMVARDGLEGMMKLFTFQPNLIILDVMMPGTNGFEVCQRIRQVSDAPLIMLTALNNEAEILRGLEAGADDFLSKPFNGEILLARSRAVLRRSENSGDSISELQYDNGHLMIDVQKRMVSIEDVPVVLTPLEFRLLVYLVRNAGKVLTFEQILANIWGPEYQGHPDYVHVYVSHLRRKLNDAPKSPRYIQTIHGVGYSFQH